MSKTTLSAVIVLVVIAVGGYFALHSKNIDKGVNNAPITNNNETATPEKKIAFSEFIKKGGSFKCEVKQSMSDMENSGTVYFSGGNTRGEFNTIAEGRNMDTTFVVKDGYSYTWSSMMPTMGFKIKLKTDTTANPGASASGTYSWNADQIGDYNCDAWTADDSKFTLPTNITFKEIPA